MSLAAPLSIGLLDLVGALRWHGKPVVGHPDVGGPATHADPRPATADDRAVVRLDAVAEPLVVLRTLMLSLADDLKTAPIGLEGSARRKLDVRRLAGLRLVANGDIEVDR